MIKPKPEYDSEKFLYKIKKWGSLNPDVSFLLFTDHTLETNQNGDFDFTFIVILNDCIDFTDKPQWINYFGRIEKHTLSKEGEGQSITVAYVNGPRVKFTLFETKLDSQEITTQHAKILVNKHL